MSANTNGGKLLETVLPQTLEVLNHTFLLERASALLSLTPITLAAQAEARAISSLLATGSINSRRVMHLILGLTPWGEGFPIIPANAGIVNPLIRLQHEIWDNLALIVRHGELPCAPVSLTDTMENRDSQKALAPLWLATQAEALQDIHKLGIMSARDILAQLPPFVAASLAKDWFGGPFLLGYALYQQQTRPDGTRQSVNHGALQALASTLAVAVITTGDQLSELEPNEPKANRDNLATGLAWHIAVLRSFVVAALDDPDTQLQYGLATGMVVSAQLIRALGVAVDTNAITVSWDGSSANQLNLEIRQKAGQDLAAALADSVLAAMSSPLHIEPR